MNRVVGEVCDLDPLRHSCYPFTVTDQASRFLLLREALDSVARTPPSRSSGSSSAKRGLPVAIRSDNGVPFASPYALSNLSRLAVWWLRLGITIERIQPGHPQQSGRHQRMHLTLKQEATRPPGMNSLQQKAPSTPSRPSSMPSGPTGCSP